MLLRHSLLALPKLGYYTSEGGNYEDVEKDAFALYYGFAIKINRAHSIAVTHVYGIDESGVQLPVGPPYFTRWGGRAVEGAALEKPYTGNGIVSSNLTPTADNIFYRGATHLRRVSDLKA